MSKVTPQSTFIPDHPTNVQHMARRKKEDAQLTRDAILDAAEQVFRDKGVARTRMEDIALGANCTRGAVYWHFKNKIDVLMALSERVSLPLYDQINQIIAARPADPLNAWRDHLLMSIGKIENDVQQQNICDILINCCELSSDMESLRDLERQRLAFFIDSTCRLFELARDAGQVRSDVDLALASLAMHGMIHGLMRLWLRQSGGFALRDSVAASADLLLAAMRTESP